MATMVKEKKREKKKPKEMNISKRSIEIQLPLLKDEPEQLPTTKTDTKEDIKMVNIIENTIHDLKCTETSQASTSQIISEKSNIIHNTGLSFTNIDQNVVPNTELKTDKESSQELEDLGNTYQDLNDRLDRIAISQQMEGLATKEIEDGLNSPKSYIIKIDSESIVQESNLTHEETIPSAPVFEEEHILETFQEQHVSREYVPKVQCIPLEEAARLFGSAEISELKVLSDREEALVEAGPVSGPEHPLVDLLSTFRSSLIAVDRERLQLARGFIEEEKFRTSLWIVMKRVATATEKCKCDSYVHMRASFEQAKFMTEKVPVARLKLDSLLKDLQESYCHYQYAALLAHFQIEQLISELLQANKPEIREALSLILQALRLCDGAPEPYALALQRWAGGLAGAMVDGRDIRQLLFLLHHLFRQTRSVRWATNIIHLTCMDRSDAAQTIALLDLLLTKLRLDSAVECTEDSSEVWEEVDTYGSGSVIDGKLRERDLILLVKKLPLSQLAARLLLITQQDITTFRPQDWSPDPRSILSCCHGARCLLDVVHRGLTVHTHYMRLRDVLLEVMLNVLEALGYMFKHVKHKLLYSSTEVQNQVLAELEECFCAGFELVGVDNMHRLPATLLSDDAARDYCATLITTLHDNSPKQLMTLRIEVPSLSCDMRVRIVSQASIQRTQDHDLARMVLDFLFQTGIKHKSPICKGSCGATARECLPKLLDAHPYLHTTAFNILAEMHQVEPLEASSVHHLAPRKWRPRADEMSTLLREWTQRCGHMLPELLMLLDYTPHTGVSLPTQLRIASHLCTMKPPPEWCWSVLLELRLHRACWASKLDAPPPEHAGDIFSDAVALLATSWGHCVPLICTEGVSALCRVAPPRPAVATHCLHTIMLVMAQAPDSLALTDKFAELLNVLLASGPSLMQRALGRGGPSGEHLLLKLILTQLDTDRQYMSRPAIISAWLHALWRADLSAALPILEALLLATRQYAMFDSHAANLLANSPPLAYISLVTRNAHSCPMVCECSLRARMLAELSLHPRLLQQLVSQKERGSIHVDNALQQIKAGLTSEDLVIHKTSACVLVAPLDHPSHLSLWRLLMHLYLQRPPNYNPETSPPVGPLFFSGFIKSRTLTQLKKKLQETATYHHSQSESLKIKQNNAKPKTSKTEQPVAKTTESVFLPVMSISNLTGESESSASESEGDADISEEEASETEDYVSLITYHTSAEQLVNKYLCWLEEGDRTRALPHHTDIARFIPQHALEAGWQHALSLRLPTPLPSESFPLPRPAPSPPTEPRTPLQRATECVLRFNEKKRKRSGASTIKSCIDNVNVSDCRALLHAVDKHLDDIKAVARDWHVDVTKISSLNNKLFELLPGLRVRRPLPPVNKYCPNKCKPIKMIIQEDEWCISTGVERAIAENRHFCHAAIQHLSRPRPEAAKTSAALHTIARCIRSKEAAIRFVERMLKVSGEVPACAVTCHVISTVTELVAQRWLQSDGKQCAALIARWFSGATAALQRSLCSALLSSRCAPCMELYAALLEAQLPARNVFSHLSKFDMSRWSATGAVKQTLQVILKHVQRYGFQPDEEQLILLELLGVHIETLVTLEPQCLYSVSSACVALCTRGSLPPQLLSHVTRVATHVRGLRFDELGHHLRELGVTWWEARTNSDARLTPYYAVYCAQFAELLQALQRALVVEAVSLSYAEQRVSLVSWSSLLESWSPWVAPHAPWVAPHAPWVAPHAAPPLLPSVGETEQYSHVVQTFVDTIVMVMEMCRGTAPYLLRHVFEWIVSTHKSVGQCAGQECVVQLSCMLAAVAALPWRLQWPDEGSLRLAMQIASTKDKELQLWGSATWRQISAETWQQAGTLEALLWLFTHMDHHEETYSEAARLPWWELREGTLEEALDRFIKLYYSPAQAYCELPQYKILLMASDLLPSNKTAYSHNKRVLAITWLTRAAVDTSLVSHVVAHTDTTLQLITHLASHAEEPQEEIEELLSRAVVILCIEPAASASLPVWQQWVMSASPRLVVACISACAVITDREHFASLAECALKAHLKHGTTGWPEVVRRWQSCHWSLSDIALPTRPYTALALATLRSDAHRAAFRLLAQGNLKFSENEAIFAAWICLCCRTALRLRDSCGDDAECCVAASSVLVKWGEDGRMSLLKMVTQGVGGNVTPKQRLLCRLGLCILTPNDEPLIRAYEAACKAVAGSNPGDVLHWGKQPEPKRLPRLAMRLYPNEEIYFQYELDMAEEGMR